MSNMRTVLASGLPLPTDAPTIAQAFATHGHATKLLSAEAGGTTNPDRDIRLVHHLVHLLSIVTTTLSSLLSVENLTRNVMTGIMNDEAYNSATALPANALSYDAQQEALLRLLTESATNIQNIYNTLILLPYHGQNMASGGYRSLLDAVNLIVPAVGSIELPLSRAKRDELRTTLAQTDRLYGGDERTGVLGWKDEFLKVQKYFD